MKKQDATLPRKSQIEPFALLDFLLVGPDLISVEIPGGDIKKFIRHESHVLTESSTEPKNLVVLDARSAWLLEDEKVKCYQSAQLLFGKVAFESLKLTQSLRCIVLLSGEFVSKPVKKEPQQSTFDSATDRLKVGTKWINLKIVGELFIVPTVNGYAPALLVLTELDEIKHVLVGAKSFSAGLESIRNYVGQIENQFISIRKDGETKYAMYEVKHRSANE